MHYDVDISFKINCKTCNTYALVLHAHSYKTINEQFYIL